MVEFLCETSMWEVGAKEEGIFCLQVSWGCLFLSIGIFT